MMVLLALACRNPTPEDDSAPLGVVVDLDLDGDGFTDIAASGDDCDDSNAEIHPGAPEACDGVDSDCDSQDGTVEVPYDGIDQDCDGADVIDADGDGSVAIEAGGDDCADSDPTAYPADGPEDRTDGVDNNCNGWVDESYACVDGSADFGAIQEAVDATPDGSAVLLCPGTWAEQVNIEDRQITIRGTGVVPEDVIWDVTGIAPVVTVSGAGSDVTLQWMRMTGDLGDWEAAVETERTASIDVDHVDLAGKYWGERGQDWGFWFRVLDTGGGGGNLEITHSRIAGILLVVQDRNPATYSTTVWGSSLDHSGIYQAGPGALDFHNNIVTGAFYASYAAASEDGSWSGSAAVSMTIQHNTLVALEEGAIVSYIEFGGSMSLSIDNNVYADCAWDGGSTHYLKLAGYMDPDHRAECTERAAEAGLTTSMTSNIVSESNELEPEVDCWYSDGTGSTVSNPMILQAALGDGFTESDPQFQADPERGSYALAVTSPAIDAGAGAADADGSAPDIGAFGGPDSEWWKEYPWALD